jgi:hypothetical protein
MPIIALLGFVSPKMSYFAIFRYTELYYSYENNWMFPLFVCTLCFAYRLGGGEADKCFKTGVNAVILLFSGFVDIMWFVANSVNYANYPVTIPHVRLVIGHEPSFSELIIFIGVHVIFLVLFNLIPMKKAFAVLQEKQIAEEQ